MLNQKNIEIIYDAVDGYASLLWEKGKTPYLQGVAEACQAILAGSPGPEVPTASRRKAFSILRPTRDFAFAKEEVRKALQLVFLKGFKHVRRPNSDITPDTIGFLMAFLIERLLPGSGDLVLLDPLVGTGNLLVAVADAMQRKTALYGVESDFTSYKLAEALLLMTEHGDELFCQDTLSFSGVEADVILTDFPPARVADDGAYFPYEVIRHHRANMKPGGWFLGVVADDFFTIPGAAGFRTLLDGAYHVFGLVKLPSTMTPAGGRSILILQNAAGNVQPPATVLAAEIPSFADSEAAQRAIHAIGAWFDTHPTSH